MQKPFFFYCFKTFTSKHLDSWVLKCFFQRDSSSIVVCCPPIISIHRQSTIIRTSSIYWNLPLKQVIQCILTVDSSLPTSFSLLDGGPGLQLSQSATDLGIRLECPLKLSAQCIAAVKKVRAALFLVKRSFVYSTSAMFLTFYCFFYPSSLGICHTGDFVLFTERY